MLLWHTHSVSQRVGHKGRPMWLIVIFGLAPHPCGFVLIFGHSNVGTSSAQGLRSRKRFRLMSLRTLIRSMPDRDRLGHL